MELVVSGVSCGHAQLGSDSCGSGARERLNCNELSRLNRKSIYLYVFRACSITFRALVCACAATCKLYSPANWIESIVLFVMVLFFFINRSIDRYFLLISRQIFDIVTYYIRIC